jgi:site-specific recombinase XerD
MSVSARVDPGLGVHQVHGSNPWIEQANRFLAALTTRGLSPQTVRSYAFDLVIILRWLESCGLSFKKLDEAALLDFVSEQKSLGASPNSINRRLSTCRLMYRFLTDCEMPKGLNAASPGSHYRGPGRDKNLGLHVVRRPGRLKLRVKVPRTLVEPLTTEQVRSFLATLRRYRDLGLVYLMLLCGLRSREVLNIRLSDLQLDGARLRIRGKGAKERFMPLAHTVVTVLQGYLELERPPESTTSGLFVVLKGKRRGQEMTPAGLRRLFRYRRQATALSNANAHRFRHTFGTDMARAGVRLPVLQKMMGHAHAETTLLYVNLSMADIAEEYSKAAQKIQLRYQGGSQVPCAE